MELKLTDNESRKVTLIAKKNGLKRKFIKEQLVKGMAIESEHSPNPKVQKKIAFDHLEENPNYYDTLKVAENLEGINPPKGTLTIRDEKGHLEVEVHYTAQSQEDYLAKKSQLMTLLRIVGVKTFGSIVTNAGYPKKCNIWGWTDWAQWQFNKNEFYKRLTDWLQAHKLDEVELGFNGSTYSFRYKMKKGGSVNQMVMPTKSLVIPADEMAVITAMIQQYNEVHPLAEIDLSEAAIVWKDSNGVTRDKVHTLRKYLRHRSQSTTLRADEYAAGGVVASEGVDPKIVQTLTRAMEKSKCVMNRDAMPQVMSENYPDYIQYLQEKGYKVHYGSKEAKDMLPSQCDINAARVKRIIDKKKGGQNRERKYIIAKGNYIVDGHHSWASSLVDNPHEKLETIEVDAPIAELIQVTKEYPKVVYELI